MACNNCIAYVIAFYVLLLTFVATVLSMYNFSSREGSAGLPASADSYSYLCAVQHRYANIILAFIYKIYQRFTLVNAIIFFLKYIPTGLYSCRTLKNVYYSSKERIKNIQMELDDLKLKIHIMDTKMCVRDAEFCERTEQLRRKTERLRALRMRVREVMATGALQPETHTRTTISDEEHEFTLRLLKELNIGEPMATTAHEVDFLGDNLDPESVYSSFADTSSNQKHQFKKEHGTIKNHLESWQRSLNAVVFNSVTREATKIVIQDAMGDYNKYTRDYSDTDSEIKASHTDVCDEEYNTSWPNLYSYDDKRDPLESKDSFEGEDYLSREAGGGRCGAGEGSPRGVLFILPEETSSQVDVDTKLNDYAPLN